MAEHTYTYVIVGGGLAGASAVRGIRELDKNGSILLIGGEKHMPYDRPPLSKMLWFDKMAVDEIFIEAPDFYSQNGALLALGTRVTRIDTNSNTVMDDKGNTYKYAKLLLATGSSPRRLPIPGGDLEGVCYYRYLDDYRKTRGETAAGKNAVIIGGGFIGSELAAALTINRMNVTMLFPSKYICGRVLPDYLAKAVQASFVGHGVNVLPNETPISIRKEGKRFIVATTKEQEIAADIVIAGVGVMPNVELASNAGLALADGIAVNEYLQSSDQDIYAAGDVAFFPYKALGHRARIEHWDNSRAQGIAAGRNMAGAKEPFTYMPFFFTDLFEFNYEAVGEVDANLSTFADWQKEFDTGVVYYLFEGKVKGAMMCNMPDRIDAARELILKDLEVEPESLRGKIK